VKLLSGASFDRLQGAIDTSNLRQKVISNNIANAETPNFKRSEVAFETILEQEMSGDSGSLVGSRTDPRHFYIGPNSASTSTPQVNTDQNTTYNNNLNNVDIDREMSQLAQNQLKYNALIQQLNHDIKMKRLVVEGR
jgi:flagellar basal-body rod protein FlgB